MPEKTLRKYQLNQLQAFLSKDRGGSLLLPGRGKTPPAIVYIRTIYDIYKEKTAFIMPTNLFAKNKEECMDWGSFSADEVAILNVNPEKRKEIYADPKVKVFIMSFECFAKEWEMLPSDVNCMMIDEFHLGFSTHDSARTQAFYRVSRRMKKVQILTGTLVDGRYSSAYPAIAVIEPRYYLNYQNFKNYHGVFNNFNQIVAWRNPEKLKTILERHFFNAPDSEVYEGRGTIEDEIIFEPCNFDDTTQKAAYKSMEQDALLELEDRFLEASSGGVKQIRCRQILSCPEALTLKVKTQGKDESLKVHLQDAKDLGTKHIIFSVFIPEQERLVRICREMGLRTELINGETSSKRKGEIDQQFRNGELDIIVGSPRTMSTGFNWEFIESVIFMSLEPKDSSFDQGKARGNRGTRTTPLKVYILHYGTKVEARIWAIIQRKKSESSKVKTS